MDADTGVWTAVRMNADVASPVDADIQVAAQQPVLAPRLRPPRYAVHVVREHPVEALVSRTLPARLLVVGPADRRRHVLGSVARGAIRLGHCPVMVAVMTSTGAEPAFSVRDRAEL
ncbi:hypothetical protein GCM10009836_72300 [Pseudonocardia ailaonensis]|uniref:UspA domain-containing protein n=1 Tax=Pseudonocardia ailaonensis TaxID=367279 RepID=A0ABN2NQ75_9PSEU